MLASFHSRKINRRIAASAALGLGLAVQAAPLTTTDPTEIANFQNGATVQTFDNIAGVTAEPITDYSAKNLTGSPALFTKDPTQSAFFNSGGATFSDPNSNAGVPIGIVAPGGGIAGNKFSGDNVAGPLGVVVPPFTLFESGAFMEVIFPTAVSKIGLYVASGNLSVLLRDTSNSNLATGDFEATGAAGQFIGIERAAADIGGLLIQVQGQGTFTIDDFTYLEGTGGNNNTTAPDGGGTFGLALGAMSLIAGGRRFLKVTRS